MNVTPELPTTPCHNCGSRKYWLREALGPPEWLCYQCHPPVVDANAIYEIDAEW